MKKRPIEDCELPQYCHECDEFIIHRICDEFAAANSRPDDYDHHVELYNQKFKSMDIGFCYYCNP